MLWAELLVVDNKTSRWAVDMALGQVTKESGKNNRYWLWIPSLPLFGAEENLAENLGLRSDL